MREPGEVLVLVEGYDDRAFWAGFLREVCGCTASVDLPLNRYRQLEPGLQSLLKQKRGTYCYLTQSERTVVRVVPYQEQGKGTNLWTLFDENVLGRHTRSDAMLRGIVVCRDDDGLAGELPRHRRNHLVKRLEDLGEQDCGGDDHVRLQDGTMVAPVTWRLDLGPEPRLPAKQTLERAACAAFLEVFPERLASVSGWLAGRPSPTLQGFEHKAMAGTLWAGWHAADGWSLFYEALWRDLQLRRALLRHLPELETEALRALFA